jgi:hypothetical protein
VRAESQHELIDTSLSLFIKRQNPFAWRLPAYNALRSEPVVEPAMSPATPTAEQTHFLNHHPAPDVAV